MANRYISGMDRGYYRTATAAVGRILGTIAGEIGGEIVNRE